MPAYKLQGHTKFQDLDISIENKKGSVRKWYDPHGKEAGSTTMYFSYGYIKKTEGTDGDHVDVYLGPQADATHAFIVNQMKKPEGEIKKDGKAWTKFDEQKVMLGFPNAKAAKAAYLKQYDDPRFFGSMKTMPMEEFKEKVLMKENHGKKVAEKLTPGAIESAKKVMRGFPGDYKSRFQGDYRKSFGAKNLRKLMMGPEKVVPRLKTGSNEEILSWVQVAAKVASKNLTPKQHDLVERMDELGLSVLAAPYAAKLTGTALSMAPGRVGRFGKALRRGAENFHHSTAGDASEIAGLGLLVPSIAKGMAKRIAPAKPKTAQLEGISAGGGPPPPGQAPPPALVPPLTGRPPAPLSPHRAAAKMPSAGRGAGAPAGNAMTQGAAAGPPPGGKMASVDFATASEVASLAVACGLESYQVDTALNVGAMLAKEAGFTALNKGFTRAGNEILEVLKPNVATTVSTGRRVVEAAPATKPFSWGKAALTGTALLGTGAAVYGGTKAIQGTHDLVARPHTAKSIGRRPTPTPVMGGVSTTGGW